MCPFITGHLVENLEEREECDKPCKAESKAKQGVIRRRVGLSLTKNAARRPLEALIVE